MCHDRDELARRGGGSCVDAGGDDTDGNATDGNATNGNATDGNATDGNATDGDTDGTLGAAGRQAG